MTNEEVALELRRQDAEDRAAMTLIAYGMICAIGVIIATIILAII